MEGLAVGEQSVWLDGTHRQDVFKGETNVRISLMGRQIHVFITLHVCLSLKNNRKELRK